MEKQRLFAFWNYDTAPYYLGAEIVEVLPDGKVTCIGYSGLKFKPVKIVPYETGVKIQDELNNIQTDYRQRQTDLYKEIQSRSDDLIK